MSESMKLGLTFILYAAIFFPVAYWIFYSDKEYETPPKNNPMRERGKIQLMKPVNDMDVTKATSGDKECYFNPSYQMKAHKRYEIDLQTCTITEIKDD